MSAEREASFLRRHWPVVLGLGLVLVWALWPRDAGLSETERPRDHSRAASTHAAQTQAPAPATDPPETVKARLPAPPLAPGQVPLPPDTPPVHAAPRSTYHEPPYELPIVGVAPDDPHDEAMHPHPITEEHARIQRINGLIQNLNDAMSNRDVKAMRTLLAEFKALDPADEDDYQRGYGVVADCIESPGRASIAAARNFYDTYRASPLRRFVRRLCFEAGS